MSTVNRRNFLAVLKDCDYWLLMTRKQFSPGRCLQTFSFYQHGITIKGYEGFSKKTIEIYIQSIVVARQKTTMLKCYAKFLRRMICVSSIIPSHIFLQSYTSTLLDACKRMKSLDPLGSQRTLPLFSLAHRVASSYDTVFLFLSFTFFCSSVFL